MTKTNQMKVDIREAMSAILPTYEDEAPIEAAYPYFEYELSINVRPGEGVSRGTIDVHAWDNSDGYGKIDDALDRLEGLFDGDIFGTDAVVYSIIGTRSHLPNTDADIKHAHEVFDISIYN